MGPWAKKKQKTDRLVLFCSPPPPPPSKTEENQTKTPTNLAPSEALRFRGPVSPSL